MNHNTIIVFDFETGSRNPHDCEVLQLAALAINPRSLEIIKGSGFKSLIKPLDKNRVEAGALEKNRLDMKELEKAPQLEFVWKDFVKYVKRYNMGKNEWTAPIPAGINIKGFDLPIINRLCHEFGPLNKEGFPSLFAKRDQIDLLDIAFLWFENQKEPRNYGMDSLREYFGLPLEKAHSAEVDVRHEAELVIRFLRLHRNLWEKVDSNGNKMLNFKGKLKNVQLETV